MPRTLTIGTRGSRLALAQTHAVAAALSSASTDWDIRIETIASAGDEQPDAAIESLGLGVFTSAIEKALLDRRIDMAVHSLKDLPTSQPDGLVAVPVLERGDPRDVLIDRWNVGLLDLPEGARIGTSSPRRAAQVAHGRKDISLLPIRGNVETRIGKTEGPDYDGRDRGGGRRRAPGHDGAHSGAPLPARSARPLPDRPRSLPKRALTTVTCSRSCDSSYTSRQRLRSRRSALCSAPQVAAAASLWERSRKWRGTGCGCLRRSRRPTARRATAWR